MTSRSIEDYDYDLPEAAIAQRPLDRRDDSKLLRLDRRTGAISHHRFRELPSLLGEPSLLVVNDTRVFPARLLGHRPTGGKIELLLLGQVGTTEKGELWRAMGKPRRKLGVGATATFADMTATVRETHEDSIIVELVSERAPFEVIDEHGRIPLPPYIRREDDGEDRRRYQTVYAGEQAQSVAAPTAGLHFTDAVLDELRGRGHERVAVTLHVGPGTFRPIRATSLDEHDMDGEWIEVTEPAAEAISGAKGSGKKVIAVGTTVVRTLESAASATGRVRPTSGTTKLFITPGHEFAAIDGLLTNFHLPKSTLLALVSAFAGRQAVLAAYEAALASGYRFYSYGDAMLVL